MNSKHENIFISLKIHLHILHIFTNEGQNFEFSNLTHNLQL